MPSKRRVPTGNLWPLADRILDGNLSAYLRQCRRQGMSAERIARELRADHDINVSRETMRNWLAALGIDGQKKVAS